MQCLTCDLEWSLPLDGEHCPHCGKPGETGFDGSNWDAHGGDAHNTRYNPEHPYDPGCPCQSCTTIRTATGSHT